jgi:uncharacterized protein YecE (DUF72 family)
MSTSQFDLFADGPTSPFGAVTPGGTGGTGGTGGSVEAAAVDPDVAALAARLPAALRLGTSSWSFPGWRGIVYRGAYAESALARHGLAAYARHPLLRTVGLDRTFYGAIPAEEYARYAACVPEDFAFVVKAPMAFTAVQLHGRDGSALRPNPAFLDAAEATRTFVEPALRGLAGHAGPIVFQFPPLAGGFAAGPEAFAARLGAFLAALPRGPLYAVELRDRALITRAYAAALDAAGARHCVGLHPRMPTAATQARVVRALAPGPLVVRWNLRRDLGYEEAKRRYRPFGQLVDPDPDTRGALAALALETVAAGQPVWIVANNKAEGSAPLTLAALAREIDAAQSA